MPGQSGLPVRHASVSLSLGGVDVSGKISGSLISFSYQDQASDKSDSINCTLEDRDRKWQSGWMPTKGLRAVAAITVFDWLGPGDNATLPCGSFEIDEVEVNGPPDVVSIKGVSTPVTAPLRRQKNSKSWENTTLKAVVSEVAAKNGLAPMVLAQAIQIKRVDQREESDLQFLQRLAKKYGLNIKVSEATCVMFSGQQRDALSAVATITRGESWVSRFSFKTQASDLFSAAEVSYWDPEKKEMKQQTFSPGEVSTGQKLKINRRVESVGEAKLVAQGELREKNKKETEGSLDLVGDPRLVAGQVVTIAGWGKFDGPYAIESATHALSRGQGYTTSIQIRRTLSY